MDANNSFQISPQIEAEDLLLLRIDPMSIEEMQEIMERLRGVSNALKDELCLIPNHRDMARRNIDRLLSKLYARLDEMQMLIELRQAERAQVPQLQEYSTGVAGAVHRPPMP